MKTHLNNQSHYRQYPQQSGMTLLEILVVIAIVAMLSTGGMSSWQHYRQRTQLEQTSAALLAFLSRVQAKANWHNETYLLRLANQGTQRCVVAQQNKAQTDCVSDVGLTFVLSEPAITVEMTQSDIGLGFYGLRNTAGTGNLVVANAAGRIRIVISAKGRLRRCSEAINGKQPYLPGVSAC